VGGWESFSGCMQNVEIGEITELSINVIDVCTLLSACCTTDG